MDNAVDILEVMDDGDRTVGEGVLVHPRLVAVRPPLSDVLTGGLGNWPAFRLRLPGDDGAEGAVRDVVSVLLTEADEPLVAMEFAEAGPAEAAWSPSADSSTDVQDQLRAYLARRSPPDDGATGPAQGQPWDACAIWPDAAFCTTGHDHGDGVSADA